MLIDSHCHLDFPDFEGDLDAVIARARAAGIARLVTISTRVRRHAGVLAIAERYPEVYQGAMPMCGPLGAAIDFFNTGLFDMLVTFEAMFPGTIGSPYEPSAETGLQPIRSARRNTRNTTGAQSASCRVPCRFTRSSPPS